MEQCNPADVKSTAGQTKVFSTILYCLVQAVHTGPLVDRHADHSLLGNVSWRTEGAQR